MQLRINKAKKYDDLNDFVSNRWDGADEMREIIDTIDSRAIGIQQVDLPPIETVETTDLRTDQAHSESTTPVEEADAFVTPQFNGSIPTPGAPLLPANDRRLASLLSLQDVPTPSPTPRPRTARLRQ